ncbi:MAG TPA: hypothetical protein QGF58_23830 [Myxococcota bacterium]|nr:hypothetical protein [Myxococcota bacterium]
MELFEYSITFILVVIGLGTCRIVGGLGHYLQRRERIEGYWLHGFLVLIVFLAHINFWWTSWSYNDSRFWDFNLASMLIARTIVLYLSTVLVIPDGDGWASTTLKAYYRKCHRPVFLLVVTEIIGQFITDFYVHGTDLPPLKIGLRLAMLAVVGVAYKKDNELLHGLMLVGLLTMLTFNLFGFYFMMN